MAYDENPATEHKLTTATASTAVIVISLLVSVGAFATPVAADHGASANLTINPVNAEDHHPGTTRATWQVFSSEFGIPSGGLEYTNFTVLRSGVSNDHAASFAECTPTPSDVSAYGIDRGNNNSGTDTDESLLSKTKDTGNTENRAWGEFFGPDDGLGSETVWINNTDQIVVQLECVTVVGDAGWYQLSGRLNGTTWDGEYNQGTNNSHYVWICNCSSRQDAEDQLGPAPTDDGNDGTPTPTTDGTPTPTTDGTPTPTTDSTPTASPEGTASVTDSDVTAEDDSTSTETDDGTASATGENDPGNSTPTEGQGPGFGVIASVVALLAAAGVAIRRTG